MTQYEERRKCASAGNWVWKRCCVGIILSVWTFTAACTTLESAGRPVYEDPDTLVRLESIRRILSLPDVGLTHPVSLTQAQIKSLLASISARTKIGLLGSFKGTPGVPRLFDEGDIDLLSGPLQKAFERANSEEVIVFYRAKDGGASRQLVTSGLMFVRERNLVVSIANFWHPLITAAFEIGGTDKLQDIRETTSYVRDFPWISVGEQDFVIFFDDPRYEPAQRQSKLFGYPERTLTIDYQGYLEVKSDLTEEIQKREDGTIQYTTGKPKSETIAELQTRIVELEQVNRELRGKMQKAVELQSAPLLPVLIPPFKNIPQKDFHVQLQERVKHLEMRVADLEKRLNDNAKTRKAGP